MKNLTKTSAALLLALAMGLALVACGDDGDEATTAGGGGEAAATAGGGMPDAPPAPTVPTIVVRDGAPAGGVEELTFEAGEQIRFRVRSDVADEVHVHGYDVEQEVPAGGTAAFSFPADIEGIFEVELHESGEQIAELRVEP